MAIMGPKPDDMVLEIKNYKGCLNVDLQEIINHVSSSVAISMETEMGMPVNVSSDTYKIKGGLFSQTIENPALVFSSKNKPEYASIFVSFSKTAGILEVMVAQATLTSRNYQRVAQGKLFSDKASAAEEATYYGALSQAILEAIDL